jgi:hypothetical protein
VHTILDKCSTFEVSVMNKKLDNFENPERVHSS